MAAGAVAFIASLENYLVPGIAYGNGGISDFITFSVVNHKKKARFFPAMAVTANQLLGLRTAVTANNGDDNKPSPGFHCLLVNSSIKRLYTQPEGSFDTV